MSILPSFMVAEIEQQARTSRVVEIPKEYEIDFDTGQLTGRIVEGLGAIRVWIWLCLKTQRYRFPIYSWQYGTEFEDYIGQVLSDEYLTADCHAEIQEALLVNPYITAVDDFTAERNGSALKVSFTAVTTLGDLEVTDYV